MEELPVEGAPLGVHGPELAAAGIVLRVGDPAERRMLLLGRGRLVRTGDKAAEEALLRDVVDRRRRDPVPLVVARRQHVAGPDADPVRRAEAGRPDLGALA